MKDLILTAQDARELQALGALTITKPVKPAPPAREEGAVFVGNDAGIYNVENPQGTPYEVAPGKIYETRRPVHPGDAVMIREPWGTVYKEDDPAEPDKVIFAADLTEEDAKARGKWASPVSMPAASAARWARVMGVEVSFPEAGRAVWVIQLARIDRDTAEAIDAGTAEATTTGVCRHCGQTIDLGAMYATQEEADAAAEELCECPAATVARRKRAQVEAAKEKVRQLFGDGADELGFRSLAGDGAVDLLERTVELIALGPISSATFNVRGQCKAKLTVSTKGKIKVSRSEVSSCALEAGE